VIPEKQLDRVSAQIGKRLAQSVELFYPVLVRESDQPITNRIHVRHGSLGAQAIGDASDPADLKKKLVQTIA
jgi:hypothetical protein